MLVGVLIILKGLLLTMPSLLLFKKTRVLYHQIFECWMLNYESKLLYVILMVLSGTLFFSLVSVLIIYKGFVTHYVFLTFI